MFRLFHKAIIRHKIITHKKRFMYEILPIQERSLGFKPYRFSYKYSISYIKCLDILLTKCLTVMVHLRI